MSHPDDATLSAFVEGKLEGAALLEAEQHLGWCDGCSQVVAQLLKVAEGERLHGPRKGLVLGRYVVLDALGAGALGEVFAAWDSTLERPVALKWLYPPVRGGDRDALRARLLAEARALAKVQHPNVVTVHDVLAHESADVIVMELVKGARTLRQRPAPEDWRATVRAFVDAAGGLRAAHAAGVIHRDFKPDNVLVDAQGRVVVVDFGLARDSGGPADAPTAQRTTRSGTPAYLAPERFEGQPADEASDQFSVCVSLYECLTGRLPFEARTIEARHAEVRAGPPPIRARGVSARLEAIVRRGLAFEPRARWPSVAALEGELTRCLDAPRRRRAAGLLAAGALLTTGLLVQSARASRARCDGAAEAVQAVWSPARAAKVTAAFHATAHPAAATLAGSVPRALTAYADALAEGRSRACRATAFEGDSDAVLTLRTACLGRRLADLDALAAGLEAADGKTVERAVGAVEALAPANDCWDVAALTTVEPLPGGPARAAVDAAAARVSAVRAARLLGKTKESVALAEVVTAEARAAGWRPLVADALLEWGAGLERLSSYDEARPKLLEALRLAGGASDTRAAFAAAVALAYLDGVDRKRPESGQAWVAVAQAFAEPARAGASTEAVRLGNVEAVMAMRADQAPTAVTRLRALEGALEATGGLQTLNGARLLANLSAALRESGDAAAGVEVGRRSVQVMEAVLSPNHPDVAAAMNNLGSALADLGRLDDAAPYLERSLALRERLFGPEALALATPLYNLGELALRRGDGQAALAAYGRSRAIVEKARGADDDDAWDSRMGEALALGALGRHEEAVTELERVLPELVRRKLPVWNLAQAKLGLAESLLAAKGDRRRVRALLDEVASLEGPRHEAQRTRAATLRSRLDAGR